MGIAFAVGPARFGARAAEAQDTEAVKTGVAAGAARFDAMTAPAVSIRSLGDCDGA